VIALLDEPAPDGAEALLRTVMRDGRRTGPPDTLDAAHGRLVADLAALPEDALRIRAPRAPRPEASARLARTTAELRARLAAGHGVSPPLAGSAR
jgi:nicotinate phosphoribosyltransferase